jgi:Ser/Thr protein kinase RdoA (MazF antagonist)
MSVVRQVHPEFIRQSELVGDQRVLSTEELLQRCTSIERELWPDFSVFIHGDFNVSNIVYNHTEQKVHFIDLHRSGDFDFLQDVSVFLVSNFRMPVTEPYRRQRINWMISQFYAVVAEFAAQGGDRTFGARLALALARSFYTSTRFELGAPLAREMFARSHRLMEDLVAHSGRPWSEFVFPESILYYHPGGEAAEKPAASHPG